MPMTEDQIEMLIRTEARSKKNEDDIRELKKTYELMHEMNRNISLLAQESSHTKSAVEELKEDVTELKDEDGRTFKNIKSQIITIVVGAIFGALVTGILSVVFSSMK